jgi:hypothetical protein
LFPEKKKARRNPFKKRNLEADELAQKGSKKAKKILNQLGKLNR